MAAPLCNLILACAFAPGSAVSAAQALTTPALAAQVPAGAQRQQPLEDSFETRSFSLPDTRAVRDLWDRAEGHIAARRWSEALTDLQSIIEQHASEVLGAERELENVPQKSQQAVHAGAAQRARQRLWSLPQEAQRLYRERHEAEASAAFLHARAHLDAHALATVARRWPLTESGQRAWWALGDLELEHGHRSEALFAWSRAIACALATSRVRLANADAWKIARARLTDQYKELPAGIERRIRIALESFAADARERAPSAAGEHEPGEQSEHSSALRLCGPGEGGGPPPSASADSWASAYRLPNPTHPFVNTQNQNLFPVRSADTLLVSTSMRLVALNAYSGALQWDSGEAPGWSELAENERREFFLGIDANAALIAPAASEHIALAALQIPLAFIDNDEFQKIPITTRLPDRRLFAFDLATGRRLWNHLPPLIWDGESGSFTDRMSVAGPPTIVGSRVLAPYCRMQGRIDYHVGCFDLESGTLLWSTDLISGQRELNMFGRPEHEFCAPPLCVVGDRVIALTQLGAIACLDLFTGEIVWETVYDQIALPRNREFRAAQRQAPWKNTPPLCTQGAVIATPFDSRDMLGLDFETGALVWSLSHDSINRLAGGTLSGIDLLLGAGKDVVYLSGSKVLALEARGGLKNQAPNVFKWAFDDDDVRDGPRPVLGRDRIVIPTPTQRIEIELDRGRRIADTPWAEGQNGGNLLLENGELFTLSRTQAQGYFEWDALVARARRALASKPDAAELALDLGRLLANRGAAEWQRGETEAARVHLAEARTVLERALVGLAGEKAAHVTAELHAVLRSEARVRADLADSAGALRALHQARQSAPSKLALRDTLLEEFMLLRGREALDAVVLGAGAPPSPESSEILAVLDAQCAELSQPCEVLAADDAQTNTLYFPLRFTPILGAHPRSDSVPCEIPVGLWVAFEKCFVASRRGDSAVQFVELHRVLERYGDVPLAQASAGEFASERIGALLRAGHDEGYAPFEARAKAAFEAAVQAHDREQLARVPRIYPCSASARAANDALLDWALDAQDATSVASIVQSELPATWTQATASEREVRLCLRLAAVLAKLGNRELADELVRTLASHHPELTSDLAQDGARTLKELSLERARWRPAIQTAAPGRFAPNCKQVLQWSGEHEILGFVQADDELARGGPGAIGANEAPRAGERSLLIARVQRERRAATLIDIEPAHPTVPAWSVEVALDGLPAQGASNYWSRHVVFAQGRVIVAANEAVQGLDARDGKRVWEWQPDGGVPEALSIACASGVVIAVVNLPGDRYFIQALDARTGARLWREGMQDAYVQRVPLLSSNQLVFLPNPGRKQLVVRDLFSGRRARQIDLGVSVTSTIDQDAWIEDERLIVPWFSPTPVKPERNQLIAYDLESGARAWRVGFDDQGSERRGLSGILQHGEKTYLIVSPWPNGDRSNPSSQLFELHTGIGALAPLSNVRLGPEDKAFGLPRGGRLRLAAPQFFLRSSRSGISEARLRAIDLDAGELWAQSLPVPVEEIYSTSTPAPALSDATVAIAYTLAPMRQQKSTSLLFFDRATGLRRGEKMLASAHGTSDKLQLVPLGDALIVKGRDQLEILQ